MTLSLIFSGPVPYSKGGSILCESQSQLLILEIAGTMVSPTWVLAGWVWRAINTDTGVIDAAIRQKAYLGKRFYSMPGLGVGYNLKFEAAEWVRNTIVNVWEVI